MDFDELPDDQMDLWCVAAINGPYNTEKEAQNACFPAGFYIVKYREFAISPDDLMDTYPTWEEITVVYYSEPPTDCETVYQEAIDTLVEHGIYLYYCDEIITGPYSREEDAYADLWKFM